MRALPKTHEENITLAGCWAHARRNFYEAREQAPQRSGWILRQIGHLYRIEDTLRRSQAGPKKRAAVSVSQSAPAPRSGPLQKVSSLPASQRHGTGHRLRALQLAVLGVYLEDGRIQIDNNLVENSIRPTALGKNWLHVGSQEAGPKIAAILSIMETCKRLQINLRKYLNDVLPKLPSWPINNVAALSPLNWKSSG